MSDPLSEWEIVSAVAQAAGTLTGKVVRIADGDTLALLVDRQQVKIRLEGIDAPEKGQPYGTKAATAHCERWVNTTRGIITNGFQNLRQDGVGEARRFDRPHR